MALEPVIGLEVHVHLNTQSKLFCGCKNVSEADEANHFVCPICMGFPGSLPALNAQAVEYTILAGLALGCRIAEHSTFARKSYFYPDLPKGYQISQYEEPLCLDGLIQVFVGDVDRRVKIQRVHLEEDAAKNIHTETATLVDHNRAGTPLLEIVTDPDLRSPAEAKLFLEDLQRTMRYLGISNADMEKGDLRVDANISMRVAQGSGEQAVGSGERHPGRPGALLPPPHSLHPKTEIKNLNSFRAVERALTYEIQRQTGLWEAGTPPTAQSTRGWDDVQQVTVEQRVKEKEADYRYFPEPDIPPLTIEPSLIEKLYRALPELPHAKEERYRRQYRLSAADAHLLVEDRARAEYAEEVFSEIAAWVVARPDVEQRELPQLVKLATNYLLGDIRTFFQEEGVRPHATPMTPENVAELIVMLHRGEVNRNAVRELVRVMHDTGGDPSTLVAERGLRQMSDEDELRRLVQDILLTSPAEVDKIRAGKVRVVEFLVGRVMARTKGRARPDTVRALICEALNL